LAPVAQVEQIPQQTGMSQYLQQLQQLEVVLAQAQVLQTVGLTMAAQAAEPVQITLSHLVAVP
jgi:hypothetical protein